jgi:hypothetical protein
MDCSEVVGSSDICRLAESGGTPGIGDVAADESSPNETAPADHEKIIVASDGRRSTDYSTIIDGYF